MVVGTKLMSDDVFQSKTLFLLTIRHSRRKTVSVVLCVSSATAQVSIET